jgi:hypothetical protein
VIELDEIEVGEREGGGENLWAGEKERVRKPVTRVSKARAFGEILRESEKTRAFSQRLESFKFRFFCAFEPKYA